MIIAAIAVSLVIIAVAFYFLRESIFSGQPDSSIENNGADSKSHVPEPAPEDLLPNNLKIGKPAAQAVFQSSDGSPVPLEDVIQSAYSDVWFSFGNGAFDREYEALAAAYGMTLVTVGEPSGSEPSDAVYSDPEHACYALWGLQTLPSDIVLDSGGAVVEYHAGALKKSEAEGMLKRASLGRDKVSFAFIEGQMSDGEGGFYTNTDTRGNSPFGKDVLSESQGLMLMYALSVDDRVLFDKTWQFTKTNLLKNGIAAWYVSADGVSADVNALLDDLRIWFALYQAGQKWDGLYQEDASAMLAAVENLCLDKKGRLVDFTDLNKGDKADTISLQYLDLTALKAMAEADADFEPVYRNAEKILLEGRISDEFPLYYKSYNYRSRSYDTGNLNTAEALYTLWNLSRAGLLPEDTLEWLKEKVMAGTLGARYRTNGDVVFGYDFHSTAVYGLAALIAQEAGDDEMYETALRRMERKLILDVNNELYGAYTQKGATIYSFDQLIPLLVNAALNEKMADGSK